MSLLISLLIAVVIIALIIWAIGLIPLPAPFGNIARVLVIIIAVIYLAQRFL